MNLGIHQDKRNGGVEAHVVLVKSLYQRGQDCSSGKEFIRNDFVLLTSLVYTIIINCMTMVRSLNALILKGFIHCSLGKVQFIFVHAM